MLVLYLTLGMHVPHCGTRINLLFFLPCALVSILMNWKKKLIHWKSVIPMALGGWQESAWHLAGRNDQRRMARKTIWRLSTDRRLIELFGKPKKEKES